MTSRSEPDRMVTPSMKAAGGFAEAHGVIDLREAMDHGRIVLARYSVGAVGLQNGPLFAGLTAAACQLAAFTRIDLPPEKRTPVFYRGYDVYDPQNMGFVSSGAEAARVGFKYDTGVPGNGNGGHLYGTSLNPADKAALIEYLKTL